MISKNLLETADDQRFPKTNSNCLLILIETSLIVTDYAEVMILWYKHEVYHTANCLPGAKFTDDFMTHHTVFFII